MGHKMDLSICKQQNLKLKQHENIFEQFQKQQPCEGERHHRLKQHEYFFELFRKQIKNDKHQCDGESQNNCMPLDETRSKQDSPAPQKRKYLKYSEEQIEELRATFETNHQYPTPEQRMELAANIGLTVQQVSCWFSNERYKIKRERKMLENAKKTAEKLLNEAAQM